MCEGFLRNHGGLFCFEMKITSYIHKITRHCFSCITILISYPQAMRVNDFSSLQRDLCTQAVIWSVIGIREFTISFLDLSGRAAGEMTESPRSSLCVELKGTQKRTVCGFSAQAGSKCRGSGPVTLFCIEIFMFFLNSDSTQKVLNSRFDYESVLAELHPLCASCVPNAPRVQWQSKT